MIVIAGERGAAATALLIQSRERFCLCLFFWFVLSVTFTLLYCHLMHFVVVAWFVHSFVFCRYHSSLMITSSSSSGGANGCSSQSSTSRRGSSISQQEEEVEEELQQQKK